MGQEKFWKDGVGWVGLSSDPLRLKNAHGHDKNHPLTTNEWIKMIKNLTSCDTGFLLSFYGGRKDEHYENYLSEQVGEKFLKNIDFALNAGVKVVYLHDSTSYPYFKERVYNDNNRLIQELKSWCVFWFPKIKNIEQKVSYVGGLRDFISYNMNSLRGKRIHEQLEYNLRKKDNLLFLDCKDLWYDGLDTMKKIFNFLQLSIKQDCVESWLSFHKKWVEKINDFEKFERLLPEIAECIVKGKNFNLEVFLPNIIKESLIMEEVLSKHGRRLKIKNLDIFPKDAIELHKFIKN